jgi:hypothetical protein
MSPARMYQGGCPRTQRREDDPLVTVSMHLRAVSANRLYGFEQFMALGHIW